MSRPADGGARSLHADAQRCLAGWVAPDAAQDRLRAAFLTYLAARPDGTWRSCAPAHVTASALVLDAAHERVLLGLHAKIGRWLQLGGHCEPGDATLAGVALREAGEESGLVDLVLLPGPTLLDRHPVRCRADRPSTHLDVQWVAVAPPGAVVRPSAESRDLRWFRFDALPAGVDDSVRRLVAAGRAAVAGQPGSATTSSSSSAGSRPAPAAAPSR